jgi:hypothetical protein
MASRKRYQLDRVTVEPGASRPATWSFAGDAVSGTEQSYLVIDRNFPTRNVWDFMVRIPKARGERLEIRPRTTPNLKVWAELTDRSLTFARATKGEARGRWYCQVALADPTGGRTKDVVKGDERDRLPPWFAPLRGRMRLKQNVRPTRVQSQEIRCGDCSRPWCWRAPWAAEARRGGPPRRTWPRGSGPTASAACSRVT